MFHTCSKKQMFADIEKQVQLMMMMITFLICNNNNNNGSCDEETVMKKTGNGATWTGNGKKTCHRCRLRVNLYICMYFVI